MRVISVKTVRDFWEKHRDAEPMLRAWYDEAVAAQWQTPQDILGRYRSADILSDNRVVFNIKGNTYRLVVKLNFEKQWIFIRFIGTHEEYDKIDANTI